MRKKLYLAKDGNVYINYINLNNKNILRLRDFLTSNELEKLRKDYNKLRREMEYLKIDNIINNCFGNDCIEKINRINEIRKKMQELNITIDNSKRPKTECILYTEDEFNRLLELHPEVEFIDIYSI